MASAETHRIAFLCSGGGGNLRFVHRAIELGWIPDARLELVLADRVCPASDFATAMGIANYVVDFSSADQQPVIELLERADLDLVVTTVHRILRKPVVDRFRGKLVNLHYSLLPAFGGAIGARPVQAAIEAGCTLSGATVHEVDETVDGGRPIVQVAIPLAPEDDADQVMNLIFRCGCLALAGAIGSRLAGESLPVASAAVVARRQCLFSPGVPIPARCTDEDFWATVAEATSAGGQRP